MAHNSLYPGFIKLYYTVGTKERTATIPCKPFVAVGGGYALELKGDPLGGPWITNVTAYVNVIKPLYHTSVTFTYAELWTMASEDADPIFQEVTLLGIAGTAATAPTAMGQAVVSGRTQNGGVAKLYLMELSSVVNQKLKPAYAGGFLTVANYVVGSTAWMVGRNGGFWIAVPQITTKTNDTLRRQAGLE